MLLKYFYDESLAQASYLVGCAQTGEALVVDPARDVTPYLRTAEKEGLRVTHVTETHIHADFVSGGRELAAQTGATLYLSDMGDEAWKYAYAEEPNVITVRDGDNWMVGNIRIEVVHTPGHTPEHIAFVITDTVAADQPIGVFTGDFLFVGDVGRPDLLEEAAGLVGTKEVGAVQQFHSVNRFKQLPDHLQVWPGHGAGSACGKALGAIPSTTLGYEKLFNPAFQFEKEEDFVSWLLDGQPEAPRYFAQMKRVNKEGPALLHELPEPQRLNQLALEAALQADAFVVDLRNEADYARAHVPGSISIPASAANFTTYVGWFVDYTEPLYVIIPSLEEWPTLLRDLRAIGIDNISGYFGPEVILGAAESLPKTSATDVAARMDNNIVIIDVRGRSEYQTQHIVGAHHIPLGALPQRLDEIPHNNPVFVHCASGYRSQIAASLLQAHGYDNVINLADSTEVWSTVLPTETD